MPAHEVALIGLYLKNKQSVLLSPSISPKLTSDQLGSCSNISTSSLISQLFLIWLGDSIHSVRSTMAVCSLGLKLLSNVSSISSKISFKLFRFSTKSLTAGEKLIYSLRV